MNRSLFCLGFLLLVGPSWAGNELTKEGAEKALSCRVNIALEAERSNDLPLPIPQIATVLRDQAAFMGGIPIKVVVGLGNAGNDHAFHRHNLGFRALDRLVSRPFVYGSLEPVPEGGWVESLTRTYDDAPPKTESVAVFTQKDKFRTHSGELYYTTETISGTIVIYARHLHDINETGDFVGPLVRYLGIGADSVLVIHDDFDLNPGTVRIKAKASRDTHGGLKSMGEALGTLNFARLKIGVGKPADGDILVHVLTNLTPEEEALVSPIFQRVPETVHRWVSGGVESAAHYLGEAK